MADETFGKKKLSEAESAQFMGLQARLDRLDASVEHMREVNRALWSILRERTDTKEEELKARILAQRAEQAAIRANPKPASPCPNCGRPLVKGRNTCVYCGAMHEEGDIFEGLP